VIQQGFRPLFGGDIMNLHIRIAGFLAIILLAFTLTGCGGGPSKQSTGERLDDSVVTAKVKAALLNDQDVSGTSVNVETFKGVVQLSGFVRTDQERMRAAQLARSINGVSEVRNDLQIRGQ